VQRPANSPTPRQSQLSAPKNKKPGNDPAFLFYVEERESEKNLGRFISEQPVLSAAGEIAKVRLMSQAVGGEGHGVGSFVSY